MLIPENNCEIAVDGTINKHQSSGIGTSPVNKLHDRAIEVVKDSFYIDWRVKNLLSSVFWPKRGFKIVAYRMIRHIDNRVYWADGLKKVY